MGLVQLRPCVSTLDGSDTRDMLVDVSGYENG